MLIMSTQTSEETWKLLHPELMSQEELLLALNERHVQIDQASRGKEKLVEIFRRIAMPQAQRTRFQNGSTKMEVDKPPVYKLNLTKASQIICDHQTEGPSRGHDSSLNCNVNQSTRIKLKRNISLVSNDSPKDGPNSKKREKITWP